MSKQSEKIDHLNFEDALKELEEIVRRLETGQSALEESIDAYDRGVQLKKHCEKKLKQAQSKIEKISVSEEGEISSQTSDA